MLIALIVFFCGICVLSLSAHYLVIGSTQLAAAMGISSLVIGLTVVAFGTGAPELVISTLSALQGEPDIAIGNVVGSNIFNILCVIGLCAVIQPLIVHQQLMRLDIPLMIGSSLMFYFLAWNGTLVRFEGIVMLAVLVVYIIFVILHSRQQHDALVIEYEHRAVGITKPKTKKAVIKDVIYLILGLVGIVIGAQMMVKSAVKIAHLMGISELVIGLTIVAIGTSLPEIATSIVALFHGERDLAVGNAIGSSTFNVLAVLGASAIIAPHGLFVNIHAINVDIPIMIWVMLLCLPVFFTTYTVQRWHGGLFLSLYVSYTGYLILNAKNSQFLPLYKNLMAWGVIPLITVFLIGHYFYKKRKSVL